MKTFHLERDEDVSGVSGIGVVAEGVEFDDGTVVLRWTAGEHHSTVVWADIHSVEVIHGHDGRTRIVWDDVPHIVHRALAGEVEVAIQGGRVWLTQAVKA